MFANIIETILYARVVAKYLLNSNLFGLYIHHYTSIKNSRKFIKQLHIYTSFQYKKIKAFYLLHYPSFVSGQKSSKPRHLVHPFGVSRRQSLYLLVPVLFYRMLDTTRHGYLIKHQLLGYPFAAFMEGRVGIAALKFADTYELASGTPVSFAICQG